MNIKHLNFTENADKRMVTDDAKLSSIRNRSKKRGSNIILDTDIIVENSFGGKQFTKNKMLITGSIFTLEKLFNIKSTLKMKNINQHLNVNPDPTLPPAEGDGPRYEDAICMFMCGNGGSGDSFGSVKEVKYNKTNVEGLIPFLYTRDALTDAQKKKYKVGKSFDNGFTGWYGKGFEITPEIKCLDSNNVPVPVDVENLENDDIDTFIELKLKIDKNDFIDWYTETSDINQAKINTVSLVAAFPVTISEGVIDYVECKCITAFNFNNESLENDKEIYITYRIYI